MGKFILDYYNWHGIFLCSGYHQYAGFVLVLETATRHYPLKTKIFYEKRIYKEFKELIKFKRTIGFTIISGFITGSFMVYLSSSANIPESIQSRRRVSFHFRWTCYIHWSRCLLNGIWL
jgi:DHA1 family bicyclomycin/chloramphenicol resistance-like MFS transporter